jgi:hypothetical protein
VQLTPPAAQAVQDDATARGVWVIWIAATDAAHPGQITARAHTADHHGGSYLPGVLVADTLDELRQQLPSGLVRQDRRAFDPLGVAETWD